MNKDICQCKNVRIVEGIFGQIPSEDAVTTGDAASSIKVKSYKMCNNYGTEVVVITWGATVVSIKCLDKYGYPADIVLGFDNIDNYLDPRLSQMMGCMLGRCASSPQEDERHDSKESGENDDLQKTTKAPADHQLQHDGLSAIGGSFGRRLWEGCIEDECRVVMSYLSPDGEDGYPGSLLTTVKFELTRNNSLQIAMRAVSSKPTTVNLTHSSIFNLAGHAGGSEELRAHEICLNCDRWMEEVPQHESRGDGDSSSADEVIAVPRRVGGTVMDLRIPRQLGQLIDELDDEATRPQYFTISRGAGAASLQPKIRFASRILHRKSGRYLEVYSDQPGLELCAGGRLPAPAAIVTNPLDDRRLTTTTTASLSSNNSKDECLNAKACDCVSQHSTTTSSAAAASCEEPLEFLPGKLGAKYKLFGGLSLLPRNRPNSAKIRPSLFPSATLRPGQVYYHDLLYKFGVDIDNYC